MRESQQSDAIIAIVDDDPSVRRGLERLLRSLGWKAETFTRRLLDLAVGYHSKAIVALVEKAQEGGWLG